MAEEEVVEPEPDEEHPEHPEHPRHPDHPDNPDEADHVRGKPEPAPENGEEKPAEEPA